MIFMIDLKTFRFFIENAHQIFGMTVFLISPNITASEADFMLIPPC